MSLKNGGIFGILLTHMIPPEEIDDLPSAFPSGLFICVLSPLTRFEMLKKAVLLVELEELLVPVWQLSDAMTLDMLRWSRALLGTGDKSISSQGLKVHHKIFVGKSYPELY